MTEEEQLLQGMLGHPVTSIKVIEDAECSVMLYINGQVMIIRGEQLDIDILDVGEMQ